MRSRLGGVEQRLGQLCGLQEIGRRSSSRKRRWTSFTWRGTGGTASRMRSRAWSRTGTWATMGVRRWRALFPGGGSRDLGTMMVGAGLWLSHMASRWTGGASRWLTYVATRGGAMMRKQREGQLRRRRRLARSRARRRRGRMMSGRTHRLLCLRRQRGRMGVGLTGKWRMSRRSGGKVWGDVAGPDGGTMGARAAATMGGRGCGEAWEEDAG